jgi:hypothetical protein
MSPRKDSTPDDRCGSYAGFHAHCTRKEKPCEQCLNACRAYQLKNHAKILQTRRLRSAVNAEKNANLQRQWKLENPDSIARIAQKYGRQRRARIKSNPSTPYTVSEVLETYGTDCHLCGNPIDLTAPRWRRAGTSWELGLNIDHYIPIALGGIDSLENVRPAHVSCNMARGMLSVEEYLPKRAA